MATLPFTSLRYPLSVDPARGRIAQEQDYAAHVEQLVMQVLMTAPGERINRPDFGCGVKRLVFAPASDVTATLAQATIYQALTTWLSALIVVNEVSVSADGPTLLIRVAYVVKAVGQTRYLNLQVTP
jgi:phage baseplate assembly protein W